MWLFRVVIFFLLLCVVVFKFKLVDDKKVIYMNYILIVLFLVFGNFKVKSWEFFMVIR